MNQLLRIPRWGLFLLIIGIPIMGFPFTIFGVVMGSTVLISVIYFLILLVPSAIFVLWLYSVGTVLFRELEPVERRILNYTLFRYNLFFLLGYVVLLYIFMFLTFDSEVLYRFIFLPLHLYAIFSLLYGINFDARVLSMVEREGSDFEDYFGNIFLFWFFPIGLWIVQPKMNNLVRDDDE